MSTKVRVLHILKSNQYSGAENVACQIIEMFRDEIEMIYCSPEGPICDVLKMRGIDFIPVKASSVLDLHKIVKKIEPNIIHAHDASASFTAASLGENIYKISHMHSNFEWMKTTTPKSIAYMMASKKMNKILTVSTSISQDFVFQKYIAEKTINIGNPFSMNSLYEKSNMQLCDKKYDLVYLGRLAKPKNPLFFIEIVQQVKKYNQQIKAVMVGDGELMADCRRLISAYEIEDNIELVGYLNNPYELLKKGRILCMPSISEGFGLAAVEAMAYGLPVVCSGVGGLRDLVDDSNYICKDISEYVSIINQLLSNPSLLRIASKNALDRASKLDNYMDYKEKLSTIYRKGIGMKDMKN